MNLLSSLGIKENYPIIETVHTTFSREKKGAQHEPFRSLSWVEKRVLLMYPWLKRIELRLLNRARHIIAVSDVIKNELITTYSIPEEKITVVPNGVDMRTHFKTDKILYPKKEEEFVLGYLGRMTAGKGAKLIFPIIKRGSTDERNYVKKAVSWALRNIGKRNNNLNKEVKKFAKELEKSNCKSARWIARDTLKDIQREKVRKK